MHAHADADMYLYMYVIPSYHVYQNVNILDGNICK